MKKILVSLLVLALCAPALAVVTFDIVDNADGTGTITMDTGGDVVRGVALKVTCTGDAKLVDYSYDTDPAGGWNDEFNTFIDFLAVNGTGGVDGDTPDPAVDTDDPHPYAADGTSAGIAALDATTFVVSMGMLDELEGQDGYNGSGNLVTIHTGAGHIAVSLDTVRGGVVGDAALTTNIDSAATEEDITDGCIPPTHEDYTDWVTVGKPDSWCWTRQCHGDADNAEEPYGRGFVWVGYDDLDVLIDAFRVASPTAAQLAADFNRREEAYGRGFVRVGYDDLNVLLEYFRDATVIDDCLDDDHVNP